MSQVDLEGDWGNRCSSEHGAANELKACAALMRAGYYVYRCESPHAPFDLVAYRDGKCLRVEVKSITMVKKETRAPVPGWPRNQEWDLLILVGDGAVFCFDSSTTREEVRDTVRRSYGFGPLGGTPESPQKEPLPRETVTRIHLQGRDAWPTACKSSRQIPQGPFITTDPAAVTCGTCQNTRLYEHATRRRTAA